MTNELAVTMLGASGVGKTTLLTSIYEQLEAIGEGVNLKLIPNPTTKATLEENVQRLQSLEYEMKADPITSGILGTSALAGPDSLPKFSFDLSKKDKKTECKLIFRDYPGGYISRKDPKEREFVKTLLRECAVVIIAIDTPAMVEPTILQGENWQPTKNSGKWHEAINQPEEILELFKAAYFRLNEPKLIIFAPVKCETYVQTEASAKQVQEYIKKKYAPLLDFFRDSRRENNLAVVTTPIQTVGCLIFWKIELEYLNKPRFWFRKKGRNVRYAPQDNDHLLRYILSFLLKLYNSTLLEERSIILRTLRKTFRGQNEFEQAIAQFAKERKTTAGFGILQGQQWLNL
ncbi:MAG: hypothetical protein AAGA60_22305 [Cyanobacteria bacterium P01_E01_bin.42]